eukprot:jgi/Ulvmu1/12464/UM009_0116.1
MGATFRAAVVTVATMIAAAIASPGHANVASSAMDGPSAPLRLTGGRRLNFFIKQKFNIAEISFGDEGDEGQEGDEGGDADFTFAAAGDEGDEGNEGDEGDFTFLMKFGEGDEGGGRRGFDTGAGGRQRRPPAFPFLPPVQPLFPHPH